MKILYSIQATGNGHIARAIELLPFLQKYGAVDVFLSGSNSSLNFNLPVKYRSKGLSLFYGNKGALDYWKMAKAFSPFRIYKEAKHLPVEKYDIVLNDFESITYLACKIKKVPFVHLGHQASFSSGKTPRPEKKDLAGEFILRHYVSSPYTIGLHFQQYDTGIYSPVLKSTILKAQPVNKGHVTVYLSHFCDEVVIQQLQQLRDIHFHLFSKKAKEITRTGNISLVPVNNTSFNESMISAAGVITGAGFETPAEALYLQKKLLCIPILGQYEQLCNAEALKPFNVTVIERMNERFAFEVSMWLNALQPKPLQLTSSTAEIAELAVEKGLSLKHSRPAAENDLITPADISFPLPNYSV